MLSIRSENSGGIRQHNKFYGLQILRFFMALAILNFHLFNYFHLYFHFSRNFFDVGIGGVDVFFVLSGFIIAYSSNPMKGTANFILKRLIRIVPIYWVMTLSILLISHVWPDIMQTTPFNLENLLRSLLFIPYLAKNGSFEPILCIGWTLNYEMFFYSLFALSLLIGKDRSPYIACLLIGILVALGFIIHFDCEQWKFYTNPIMVEFAYGIFLYGFYRSYPQLIANYQWLCMTLFLVSFGIGYYEWPTQRILGKGIPALFLVMAMVSLNVPRISFAPLLILFGNASYSLYLCHPYVIQFFLHFVTPDAGFIALGSIFLIIIGASIALSLLLYYLVEAPVQNILLKLID